jgi:hypothetical protein
VVALHQHVPVDVISASSIVFSLRRRIRRWCAGRQSGRSGARGARRKASLHGLGLLAPGNGVAQPIRLMRHETSRSGYGQCGSTGCRCRHRCDWPAALARNPVVGDHAAVCIKPNMSPTSWACCAGAHLRYRGGGILPERRTASGRPPFRGPRRTATRFPGAIWSSAGGAFVSPFHMRRSVEARLQRPHAREVERVVAPLQSPTGLEPMPPRSPSTKRIGEGIDAP